MIAISANQGEVRTTMDSFPHPLWNAGADETSVSDPTTFSECEQAVEAFASRAKGKITERRYSVSNKWGRVLRAKVGFGHGNYAATTLVTCWSGTGPGVQMAVEVDGCGPHQAGC
jgi:hypothetical protein